MKTQIFKLHGQVQHYAWGGYTFIPQLLGFDNAQHKPCAEYWMGAHPGGPGKLETESGVVNWNQLIEQQPEKYLGVPVLQKFGELPFLFKVLDVREMLSIQVHPTKEEAAKGYDAEEAAGIPKTAAHRNYKDRNHKPEVMIALGDFWLLHGFKKEQELKEILKTIPEFTDLQKIFENESYAGLYKYIMEIPQTQVDEILLPLVIRESSSSHAKEEPGYWVNKLYKGQLPKSNLDRGIFSIYFFNIVKLQKGEGIFQAAGVPHAYLEGQNVELMANSDNVLRGGLTPKHIDVPELLKHTIFEGIEANVLHPDEAANGEKIYKMTIADFGISEIKLAAGREYLNTSQSPELLLVIHGSVHCGENTFNKGEVIMIIPETEYTVRAIEDSLLYKAYVPE